MNSLMIQNSSFCLTIILCVVALGFGLMGYIRGRKGDPKGLEKAGKSFKYFKLVHSIVFLCSISLIAISIQNLMGGNGNWTSILGIIFGLLYVAFFLVTYVKDL